MIEVPDLEFYSDVLCTVADCDGVVSCDGDSWWCDDCGAVWDLDGASGQIPEP